MKTALNILLGIVLLVIALSFILVYANTHPPRYPLNVPPSDYGQPYERVSFVTEDGLTLAGWLIKPDRSGNKMPAVIICHGLGANKSDFTDLAVFLARRGYLCPYLRFPRTRGERRVPDIAGISSNRTM